MRHLLLPLLTIFVLACARQAEPDGKAFGAAITSADVLPAEELLVTYTDQQLEDTVRTALSGQVHEVCQAKGCWMTLAAGAGQEMMVKFKDYAFFVPKDISGREVTVEGLAYYEVVPVDELRHLAEDGGASPEALADITEPQRELRFLADGVVVK